MKNLIKYTALLVSLFAGLRLFVEELIRTGLIESEGPVTGWMETLSLVALTPLPISDLWVMAFSLSILGMVLVLERRQRSSPKSVPLPSIAPHKNMCETQQPFTLPPSTESLTIIKKRIEEEWQSLEELDKETIREMVVQGGLWESDILALLQARGFLYRTVRYDSLADRVSFVQCDYAGYHSIPPEYHSFLEGILAADYAEEALVETGAHEYS